MAKANVIATSLFAAEDAVEDFRRLLSVFMAGDDVPEWVLVMQSSFAPVGRAMEDLGRGVRRDVLPHLEDLDRVNGGMGAVAPMATKVIAGQSAPTRK